jgi:hypothetical protein
LWWNLVLQVVLTAAVFSIYAYMAEYLKVVTGMDVRSISLMLFLFGTAGLFGTLAAGWFMGLHLSGTASGFMALFAPTLFLIFLFAQSYPVAVVLVVPWGFVHAAAITLPGARTKSCARGAGVFQQSLQFLRKSRFDGRNHDWRSIHCLVWNPCSAARQHRTLGGCRPYLSFGTAALRATGSHALNLAAE